MDYLRIRREFGKIWLFLGEYSHTGQDAGVWIDQDGNKKHWSYIDWRVVAHGDTWKEFMDSASEYFRLCDMTMVEYLEEKTGCDLSEYRKHMVDGDKARNISQEISDGIQEIRDFKNGKIYLVTHNIKELSEDEKEFY